MKCGEIRIVDLARDRDQLWAEAVARYRAGSAWWLDSLELNGMAQQEQGDRYEGDGWDDLIARWVENPVPRADDAAAAWTQQHSAFVLSSTPESVCIPEVLLHAIGKRPEHWTQPDKNRVARCLRAIGWERYRDRTGDRREWRYRKTGT